MNGRSEKLQFAALPYRRDAGGRLEILLVTSRHSRRWIIPKGWPMKDTPPHLAAAREAFEEAGVTGPIGAHALGSYSYVKRRKDGSRIVCAVDVFPLRVEVEHRRWPEAGERKLRWFSPFLAAQRVEELPLKAMILGVMANLAGERARAPRNTVWVPELQAMFDQMAGKEWLRAWA